MLRNSKESKVDEEIALVEYILDSETADLMATLSEGTLDHLIGR